MSGLVDSGKTGPAEPVTEEDGYGQLLVASSNDWSPRPHGGDDKQPLAGEKIVFLGEVAGLSRAEAEQLLVAHGAVLESQLSEQTTLLLLADLPRYDLDEVGEARVCQLALAHWSQLVYAYALPYQAPADEFRGPVDWRALDGLDPAVVEPLRAAAARVERLSALDLSPETRALPNYYYYASLFFGDPDDSHGSVMFDDVDARGMAVSTLALEMADFVAGIGNVTEEDFADKLLPAFAALPEPEQDLIAAICAFAACIFTGDWSSSGDEVNISLDGQPFSLEDAIAFETVLRRLAQTNIRWHFHAEDDESWHEAARISRSLRP